MDNTHECAADSDQLRAEAIERLNARGALEASDWHDADRATLLREIELRGIECDILGGQLAHARVDAESVAVHIAERRQAEDMVRTERLLLRTIIDSLPNAIYLKDTHYRKLLSNKRDLMNMGRSMEEEVIGKTDFDVFPEETARQFFADDRRVIENGEAIIDREEFFFDQDGIKHWLLTSKTPLYDDTHTITGLLGIGHDISDRKRAEESLLESQALYHSFVEQMPAGVFRKGADGRYIFVNAAFCRLKGLTAEEIIGKTSHELFDYESEIEASGASAKLFRQRMRVDEGETHHSVIMRTGKPVEVEEVYTRLDGTRQYMHVVKSPVFSSDGTVTGSQGVLFDITAIKSLERQLVQAQKLEGIGTLAGGIAHEFNNLLAMILGSAELLQPQLNDKPNLRKYVDRIIDTSERGAAISRQLLIFSRPDQSAMRSISLSHTIFEVKEMLSHFLTKSIEIQTIIDVKNSIVMGDSGQIHQALLNLALNAGDAMSSGGTLTIKEFTADPQLIHRKFGTPIDVPYVGVSVSDTGTGVDAGVIGKIFDPFFTTKEKGKGTGLGLSIVHGIVKSHNGFIDVESVPGEGTTFTIYLPSASSDPEVTAPVRTVAAAQHTETILLVDDESMIREMLSEYLAQSGYRVIVASNGTEALHLYERHGDEIQLVITDLGMPQMGGEELYRRLKNIDPSVKVIASSGYLEAPTMEDLNRVGFKEILTKPFKMQDIVGIIDHVLNSEHA